MQVEIPREFKEYALRLLGAERSERFFKALEEQPAVSVRLNPLKTLWLETGAARMKEKGYEPVPWAADWGFYLKERPSFTFDPLLHAGVYYVQEASSMFLVQAIQQYVPGAVNALDLCAAPGGKSTLLRSILPEGSLLVSNEPMKARAQVLAENMTKWGHPDVVVTQSYPVEFGQLGNLFDLMVTDVPCSGEGMFRKEEDAVTGWSMENVLMCRDRQREILRDVWPALKPGGLLIYSTCTLNSFEDEENVAWIARELGAEVLPVEIRSGWDITGNLTDGISGAETFHVYHFIQGFTRGEGFFMAVLRKTGEPEQGADTRNETGMQLKEGKSKKKHSVLSKLPVLPDECRSWLSHSADFEFRLTGDEWSAFRKTHLPVVELLERSVKVLQAGIPMAVLKGRDWMPLHGLAMSVELNRNAFPVVEVDAATSVTYLRKESLVLSTDTPKGYVLLTHRNVPLGFVKNVGGRANNLYPQEWKIRSTYPTMFSLL